MSARIPSGRAAILISRALLSSRSRALASSYPSRDEWWGRQAGSDRETTRAVQGEASTQLLSELRRDNWEALLKIPEVRQLEKFRHELASPDHHVDAAENGVIRFRHSSLEAAGIDRDVALRLLRAGMMTFCSHAEARVAAFFGQGFYTIGPCGEELLAAVGEVLRPNDFLCLHYRHLATQFARHLKRERASEDSLLARARAHTVSVFDEVTGGVHCALGGHRDDKYSFIATSTLASQCPPAVGRALGAGLAARLGVGFAPADAVSYVSLGDGSINNAHFLTALNFAEYAKFRGFKCPVVFGVTDNHLSISLKGYGWFSQGFLSRINIARFVADGRDLAQVYTAAKNAITHARRNKEAVILAVTDLPRRFGHAATDRQDAYLTPEEIASQENANPLLGACLQAIEEGIVTREELIAMFDEVHKATQVAFDKAAQEPKVSADNSMQRLQRVPLPPCEELVRSTSIQAVLEAPGKKLVMRKAMTSVLDELLTKYKDLVYIGEDVEHGGYYLVTEGLAKKFPVRVRDFPPDETMLIGAGQGFSQTGLTPIVEIPYAKYLDCGMDMFLETIFTTWLSNAAPSKGILYRLQGFDKGVFGGNHHTTNVLTLPPGLDVVCYSCGEDYVRGWRFLVKHVREGRMAMSVDSTNLLNKRHCFETDDAWRRAYPEQDEEMHIHTVIRYDHTEDLNQASAGLQGTADDKSVLLVSYGNGVPTCLEAAEELRKDGIRAVVVDTPLISEVPHGLRDILAQGHFQRIVFADVCKQGQHPYAGMICQLQAERYLPEHWQCVTAMPTYNPLGSTVTFLSKESVVRTAKELLQ
eukprot:m.219769 g.219769  ORF g.219769 m.219769 type:complete len:815 (+) comp17004_c3_seq1:84-2528(+)